MATVTHWNTWRKKNNPTLYSVQDSSLGMVYVIEPTLKRAGFLHTREEIPYGKRDVKPKKVVTEVIDITKYKEVVYYIYNHSRGYCSYVEIFYR